MMYHHHYYCYKLGGGVNACPWSAALIQRKPGSCALSRPLTPSAPRQKISLFRCRTIEWGDLSYTASRGHRPWQEEAGEGSSAAASKHVALSLTFHIPSSPSLWVAGQCGTFSGPDLITQEGLTLPGKHSSLQPLRMWWGSSRRGPRGPFFVKFLWKSNSFRLERGHYSHSPNQV